MVQVALAAEGTRATARSEWGLQLGRSYVQSRQALSGAAREANLGIVLQVEGHNYGTRKKQRENWRPPS